MYAVFQAGGHQYRAQQGDQIDIDYVAGNVGDKLKFEDVLMLGGSKVVLGDPMIKGASVQATIKEQRRADKVLVFKWRRRKNSKKMRGHRQPYTVVEIDGISG